jgi:hypothetical protein
MERVKSSEWLDPVKTGKTVLPLGTPSLLNAVEPPEAIRRLPPDDTAVKVVDATPPPHANVPPLTPQLPFEEVMVKPDVDPLKVIVARVWVDQVPNVRIPPIVDPPWIAWTVPLVGKLPSEVGVGLEAPVDEVGLEPPEPPDFGGYLIPLEGQEPALGASIATNCPSITDPLRLKYQLIWFSAPDVQSRAGVNPDCAFKADVS